jgi:thymidylate synthase (FAD)
MTVVLIDHMGDDLRIVNSARVSYGKESSFVGPSEIGLIKYLMKNSHGTPFEMVAFTFKVTTSIAVAREWMRHRIGSFNEISTRYVEMEPNFYYPNREDIRHQVGKPGHYVMETIGSDIGAHLISTIMEDAYLDAYEKYTQLLELGVAKELARNVLPLGLTTEFYWTVNLRSLFNFLELRTHETALKEIRIEAQQVEDLIKDLVPVAYEAWVANGRIAP